MYGARTLLAIGGLAAAWLCAAPAAYADDPMEAGLLEISGSAVKLDKGETDGVRVGQIFDLYQDAKVYRLPLTNGDVPLVQSQRRVARVQVVKTEPSTSVANLIVHDDGPDGKPIPLKSKALHALHNPTAIAPNRRPTFLETPTYKPIAWRDALTITLPVSNEKDDALTFSWKATGGRLLHDRTIFPSNRWYAPLTAGDYTISVVAHDSAGNETRTAFTVKSSGDRGRPSTYKSARQFGAFSGFGKLGDVAFDTGRSQRHMTGRRFLLSPKQGWGSTVTVRVMSGEVTEGGGRIAAEDREFIAIAAARGALFALEADRKTILRFPFGGSWKGLFNKEYIEFGLPDGGTGNARFRDPVDIATSLEGDLYVLDAQQRCVQVFSVTGKSSAKRRGVFLVSFGHPGDGELELQEPRALAVGRDGTVYVLDDGRKRVVVYKDFRPVYEFPAGGAEEPLIGIAVDGFTNDVFVLTSSKVKHFSGSGRERGGFGDDKRRGSPARISRPIRLRIDPMRVLWVIDHEGEAVARFDTNGRFLGRKGGIEFQGPLRVAGAPDGGFAVLDREDSMVTRYDATGWITARFGAEGTKADQFEDPVDIAIGRAGDVFVLDAGKKAVLRFSRQGAHIRNLGRPGTRSRELTGVRDLSMTNDRAYAVVVQQRNDNNFNLLSPSSGASVRTFGKLSGDLTPRMGCVSGVTGSMGEGHKASAPPWFWLVNDDQDRIYRQRRGGKLIAVDFEFDEITDIEVSAINQVFVADHGEGQVLLLGGRSRVRALKGTRIEDPWDLGIDGYGRVYVYDKSRKLIVELVPDN